MCINGYHLSHFGEDCGCQTSKCLLEFALFIFSDRISSAFIFHQCQMSDSWASFIWGLHISGRMKHLLARYCKFCIASSPVCKKQTGHFPKVQNLNIACASRVELCWWGGDGVRQLVRVGAARNRLLSARTLHLATNIPSPGARNVICHVTKQRPKSKKSGCYGFHRRQANPQHEFYMIWI